MKNFKDNVITCIGVVLTFAALFAASHWLVTTLVADSTVVDTSTKTIVAEVTGKDRTTQYSPSRGTTTSYTICVKWDNGSKTIYVDADTYALYVEKDMVGLDIITYTLGNGNTRVEYVIREVQ